MNPVVVIYCQLILHTQLLSDIGRMLLPLTFRQIMVVGYWVWVNTYRYIFSGMNIHFNPAMTWGSLGTRVLTHPHIISYPDIWLIIITILVPVLHSASTI